MIRVCIVYIVDAVQTQRVIMINTPFFRRRGYKTFFMLNSIEHEIFSTNKYENANNSWHFHLLAEKFS